MFWPELSDHFLQLAHPVEGSVHSGHQKDLGSNLGSAAFWLCDRGQVNEPL